MGNMSDMRDSLQTERNAQSLRFPPPCPKTAGGRDYRYNVRSIRMPWQAWNIFTLNISTDSPACHNTTDNIFPAVRSEDGPTGSLVLLRSWRVSWFSSNRRTNPLPTNWRCNLRFWSACQANDCNSNTYWLWLDFSRKPLGNVLVYAIVWWLMRALDIHYAATVWSS